MGEERSEQSSGAPTVPRTYPSSAIQVDMSSTRAGPGLGIQPLLCRPGTGSSCLLGCGSLPANVQPSERIGTTERPTRDAGAKNGSSRVRKLNESSCQQR